MPETNNAQRSRHSRSLTFTLALAFLALSVLVLIVSVTLQLFFSFNIQENVVANQQRLVAEDAASAVKGFIVNDERTLEEAANLNGLIVASSGDQRLILNKLIGRNAEFRQVFIVDAEGGELQRISRLPIATSTYSAQIQADMLSMIKQKKSYVSPIYINATTNEPLVLIASPAEDIFRDPKGALVAEVNLKFMWDLVGAIKVGENGTAYVVDKQGALIAYGDTSRVLARENLSSLTEVSQFKAGHIDSGVDVSKGIQGTYVVSGFVPLGTPDWAVVVELPVREAYANLLWQLLYSFLIMLLSAALAVFVGVYLARRITSPLRQLNAAADELSQGKLETRIRIPGNNEIGHLAESFNVMASRLQELYAGLDAKVQQKTAALSLQVGEVERSKSAILNLLEDIEEEKHKVEGIVEVRTKELRAEKARLLASINSLSFGFVLSDSFDTIMLKNPALKKILEYEREPQTIHDLAEILKATNSKIDIDVAGTCRRCMELKEPVEFKEVGYGKKFLRVICSPVLSDTGAIGYIFLIEDITEAKVMERSRDEFFAVASHELRTPLTAIRGNADMILEMYADKITDKDMKEMLMDINSSSVRLIDIVNDFLEVSRLEQGKIEMKLEQFDPKTVVEKVMRDLKEMIAKKGLALTYTPPESIPMAFADKNRTEQILVNLVGNSAKFTRAGSIAITMQQEGDKIRFRVTDTGVGISEQNQSLLFRKFQQAGEKMLARDVSQSTGLGLYICKLIVGNMGGDIGLEKSELDKGSVFFFTIPVAPKA